MRNLIVRRLAVFLGTAAIAAGWTCIPRTGVGIADESDAGVDAPTIDGAVDLACQGVDLAHDAVNCGACGHDCFGGECAAGRCQPVVIVRGLTKPVGLVHVEGTLYVGATGRIKQYQLDGGAPRDIATTPLPGYLAATKTHLYWSDRTDEVIRRLRFGASSPEVVVANAPKPNGVATTGSHLYFGRFVPDGGVERTLLDGGSRETVIGLIDRPEGLEIVANELIVASVGDNQVAVFADAGFGKKRVLVPSAFRPVSTSVADDGMVYFAEQGADKIRSVPLDGGSSQVIASETDWPTGIATTADSIYWVLYDQGMVVRLAR